MLPADRLNQSANRARERKRARAIASVIREKATEPVRLRSLTATARWHSFSAIMIVTSCENDWSFFELMPTFQISCTRKNTMTRRIASAAGPRIRHLFGLGVSERASERRARVVSHRKWVCAHTIHAHSLTDSEGREEGPTARGKEGRRESCRIGAKTFTRQVLLAAGQVSCSHAACR